METLTPSLVANRRIARAAATVMAAFIFSSLVGLARGVVIAHAFGTSANLDSFNSANRITELLFNLVAGGALASAFIPTFTGFLTRDDRHGAWRLASAVVNLVLGVLIAASLLAAVLAPQIVRYVLFALDPSVPITQFDLTVTLLRTMLPSVAIFGVSGLLMGILNANQVFLVPAIAPAMYSLGMMLGVWLLAPALGIQGLALGTVIGAGLHLLVQLPSVWRLKGRRYFLSLGRRNPAVKEVIRLMAPRLFGVAIVQLNFIINTIIAMGQPAGSVSSITLAFSLMMMPEMAIAQSIAIASLPTFSEQVARDRRDDMRSSLAATLRSVLFLALPASIGLIVLRRPLVAFLYQRGAFNAISTELVAWALLFYAGGLVFHSVVEIVSRAFYALHDTRTPVLVGVCAMSLNVALSLALSSLFASQGWMPHGGLALANSIATALEMTALLVLMRRRLNGLQDRKVWAGLGQALLATAVMGLAVFGWTMAARDQRAMLVAGGGVVLGGGIYALMGVILRVPELTGLARAVRRRIGL
jgi:putative peptidoglycan lipid II flippase